MMSSTSGSCALGDLDSTRWDARSTPQGRFRDDPHSPAVYALEHYEATLGTASKAAIFTERVVAPRAPRLGAETAEDAVAICLDIYGRIDLPEIARD
jgi:N12 class adenine-specific DNA methylase